MSEEAKTQMALYLNLQDGELQFLESIDGDIAKIFIEKGVTVRPLWTSIIRESDRFVQLCLSNNPQANVLFELQESEFHNLTSEELLARLRNSIL